MFSSPVMGIRRGIFDGKTADMRYPSVSLLGMDRLSGLAGSWLLNNNLAATSGNAFSTLYRTAPSWNSDRKIYTPYFVSTTSWMDYGEGYGEWSQAGNSIFSDTPASAYGDKSALTMMIWFRLHEAQKPCGTSQWDTSSDGEYVLMADCGMMGGYTLCISLTPGLRLKCSINDIVSGSQVTAPNALTIDDTFHHVVGIWSAANGGSLHLYLDKILVASTTNIGSVTTWPDINYMGANQLNLGGLSTDMGIGNFFTGDLSQPKFFCKKVGADLIAPIYDRGQSNLAAYIDNRNNITDYI